MGKKQGIPVFNGDTFTPVAAITHSMSLHFSEGDTGTEGE